MSNCESIYQDHSIHLCLNLGIYQFKNLTTLGLQSFMLTGRFPDKIFWIRKLSVIDLSLNENLFGFFFSKLPRWISLEHCSYRSHSIGNLRHLSELDLSHCQFNGTLPNLLSNLTQLAHLDFSFNNFTGPLPSFGMAKKLTHLHLSQNGLSGAIPSSSHFEGLQNHLSIDLNNISIHGAFLRLFLPFRHRRRFNFRWTSLAK